MTRMPPRINRRGDGFRGSRGPILDGGMISVSPTSRAQEKLLEAARGGDEDAFGRLVEPHRRELNAHCYRMLGSIHDAEDALQETLLRAWRGLPRFEGRSSLRVWLYRIATNSCLNLIERRPKRVLPTGYGPAADSHDDLGEPLVESVWVEPFPDEMLASEDAQASPDARYEAREGVELAFVAALQHLPARQRAVLILREVLGFSADEVAEMLDISQLSVKGALQRARAALGEPLPAADRERAPLPDSARERELVGRFADAFQRRDVDEVIALLTDDAMLTMPPWPLEYQGHEAIAAYLSYRAQLRGTLLVVPTRANTQPALGCYLPETQGGIARPYSLIVLTLEGNRIAAITRFVGHAALFGNFGLPPTLRP
jgi:RNA polymerase sigma-70 factor (ECF subfamily)